MVTHTEFARRVGVSRQRIGQLADAGRLPSGDPDRRGRRKIPWEEGKTIWDSDHALHTGQPMAPEPDPVIDRPVTASAPVGRPSRMDATAIAMEHARGRAAGVVAQAKIRHLKYEQLKEILVPKADVMAEAENVALLVRSAMQGLPSKLAPRLEGRTADEIEALLVEEIDQALLALHESRYSADPLEKPRA